MRDVDDCDAFSAQFFHHLVELFCLVCRQSRCRLVQDQYLQVLCHQRLTDFHDLPFRQSQMFYRFHHVNTVPRKILFQQVPGFLLCIFPPATFCKNPMIYIQQGKIFIYTQIRTEGQVLIRTGNARLF